MKVKKTTIKLYHFRFLECLEDDKFLLYMLIFNKSGGLVHSKKAIFTKKFVLRLFSYACKRLIRSNGFIEINLSSESQRISLTYDNFSNVVFATNIVDKSLFCLQIEPNLYGEIETDLIFSICLRYLLLKKNG